MARKRATELSAEERIKWRNMLKGNRWKLFKLLQEERTISAPEGLCKHATRPT